MPTSHPVSQNHTSRGGATARASTADAGDRLALQRWVTRSLVKRGMILRKLAKAKRSREPATA